MQSFTFVIFFTAAVCAVLSAARPVASVAGIVPVSNVQVLSPADIAFGHVDVGKVEDVKPVVGVVGVKNARGGQSVPAIIVGLNTKLTPIVERIKAAVKVDVEVDVNVVKDLLLTVEATLVEAVAEIQIILYNPVGVLFELEGTILSVPEIATLVSTLLYLVFTTIFISVSAVGVIGANILAPVVVSISTAIAGLLVALFLEVDGLQLALLPLIGNLSPILHSLDIRILIKILGL